MSGIGNAITIIRDGGDLPFVFDRDGEDITGFICTVTVKQFPDVSLSTVVPDFEVEPVGNEWPGSLTPGQTTLLRDSSLTVTTTPFYLTAKITNATTQESREIPERFQLATSWF